MSRRRVIFDGSQVIGFFRRMSRHFRDFTRTNDEIGSALVSRIEQTFEASTDPWGRAWQPLSETTMRIAASRRGTGRGSGAKPLLDTGDMAGSITHNARPRSVEISTNKVQAATHQHGDPTNRVFGKALGPIPARPFFPIRGDEVDLPPSWALEVRGIMGRALARAGYA